MTLWGRFRTLRWIIPGYDQVFVAPICTLFAGPTSLGLFLACKLPLEVCLPMATGVIVLVGLITPPRLRHWRLIGQHRIVHIPSQAKAFVKVG
jgi:hypothetical protein